MRGAHLWGLADHIKGRTTPTYMHRMLAYDSFGQGLNSRETGAVIHNEHPIIDFGGHCARKTLRIETGG